MSTISAPDYGALNRPAASLGRFSARATQPVVISSIPADGLTAQTDAITFDTPDNSAEYSIDVVYGGTTRTVSITTDGSATDAEAATALAAAVNADTTLSAFVTAEAASAVATLTWRKGLAGSVVLNANPSSAMALATTAAGQTQYLYGHAVERTTAATGLPAGLKQQRVQKPAGSGTSFGWVLDDKATEPEGAEDVVGPRSGKAMSVVYPSHGGNELAVATGETSVAIGASVYVGSSGAEKGLVYDSTGSGRVLVADCTFESIAAPGVAIIRL